ncbi:MAG: alpha/beta fold hydrolase [Candidatus Melainabacteria bacterium]|nr:alpha/beta fold hydrolase [Candidatus Melainabacteria bacterium]
MLKRKSALFLSALLSLALPAFAADVKSGTSGNHLIAAKSVKTTKTVSNYSAKGASPAWARAIKVPYRAWLPEQKPNEVILCVHGLGFSSASFAEFGRQMAAHGSATYAIDVRGFGQWMSKGQGLMDFEACLTDIESALKTLRKHYPSTPIYVVGESMGGAIALNAASRYPDLVNGLISSVPSSDRFAKASSELTIGAKYMINKDKPVDISQEVVSRATANPTLRKKWEAEPLNRMKISPKELKQFDDFMKGNYDAAALVQRTPVLLLAGFKDKLVKPEGTIELFNAISCEDKLLMVVGDGEHLLLEENQLTEQLESMIVVWIRNQSRARGVTSHP